MDKNLTPRREFLKIGGAVVAVIPLLAITGRAGAATNASMRTALKYQDKPDGDKDCGNCMHFVPGKTPKGPGECKLIAGDTEISPQGYCTAWMKKA
jgi:hypothetical protein